MMHASFLFTRQGGHDEKYRWLTVIFTILFLSHSHAPLVMLMEAVKEI